MDQFWDASGIDAVFRDVKELRFTKNHRQGGGELSVPFRRQNGLYRIQLGIVAGSGAAAKAGASPDARASSVRAATSTSHVHALPADDLASVLHRRLHVSLDHLRRLALTSADAPPQVARAAHIACPTCAEANAKKLPHASGSVYEPSHAGRLVHADIVGPFKRSWVGGYHYAPVLVDDHTRFKFVYFLKSRQASEVDACAKRFIASINALGSTGSSTPIRVLGALHTDNAGEFLSRSFTELLDDAMVAHTTCPPHVHQLNGVAERAIGSIMSLARSYLTASALSATFWPFAVRMAVDVLNRTTGPQAGASAGATVPSSFEMLTGKKPRVLSIMPLGCRAFAVKPAPNVRKTTIDPRAWVGWDQPGAQPTHAGSLRRLAT